MVSGSVSCGSIAQPVSGHRFFNGLDSFRRFRSRIRKCQKFGMRDHRHFRHLYGFGAVTSEEGTAKNCGQNNRAMDKRLIFWFRSACSGSVNCRSLVHQESDPRHPSPG